MPTHVSFHTCAAPWRDPRGARKGSVRGGAAALQEKAVAAPSQPHARGRTCTKSRRMTIWMMRKAPEPTRATSAACARPAASSEAQRWATEAAAHYGRSLPLMLRCPCAWLLTIPLHHVVRQQEGEGREDEPHKELEQVVPVVQVLVALVALVLDADERQRHADEEELRAAKDRRGSSTRLPLAWWSPEELLPICSLLLSLLCTHEVAHADTVDGLLPEPLVVELKVRRVAHDPCVRRGGV